MNAIGWLVALLAAAGALALPYSRGFPFVLALTPFCNAYGAAVATALALARWGAFELPAVSIDREIMRKIIGTLIFLCGAILLSAFVASDILRLASESAQWVIGVGLFAAILIGGKQPHERPIVLGVIAGGVALAIAQIAMRVFEIHMDDTATIPFLISEGNNYAALFLLIALVILPAHPVARFATPTYLVLAALGVVVIELQESRAQLLIAGGVIGGVVLLRHMTPRVAIGAAFAGAGAVAFVLWEFLRESLFSSNSILSLANFQTNYSNLERLGLILHSVNFFSTHPLGAGLGASSDIFPDSPYTIGTYPSPHNTFALMIVELGWWGLVAYSVGVVALLRRGIRACIAGEAIGIAALSAVAISFIDAVFFNGSVSLIFWLLMALAVNRPIAARRSHLPMLFQRLA